MLLHCLAMQMNRVAMLCGVLAGSGIIIYTLQGVSRIMETRDYVRLTLTTQIELFQTALRARLLSSQLAVYLQTTPALLLHKIVAERLMI